VGQTIGLMMMLPSFKTSITLIQLTNSTSYST